MKSTKAEIAQAAVEYIEDLDDKLTIEKRVGLMFKEQRNSMIALLVTTTVWEILF